MSLKEHRVIGFLILCIVLAPVFLALAGCVVVRFDDPPKTYSEQ